jgi:hypothetical protein
VTDPNAVTDRSSEEEAQKLDWATDICSISQTFVTKTQRMAIRVY